MRSRNSPGLPIVLTQKAQVLAEDVRIYEALEVLREANSLGGGLERSITTLEQQRDRLVEAMNQSLAAAVPPGVKRSLPPRHLLPASVEVRDKGDGRFGLFAVESMDVDTAAFHESPLAVTLAPGSHAACAHCLRPLTSKPRLWSPDGTDITAQLSDAQLASVRVQAGLSAIEPQGVYCSRECRTAGDAGDRSRTITAHDDDTSRLASSLTDEHAELVVRHLWQSMYSDEPPTLHGRELQLWRAVRGNALHVHTQALSLVMHGANLEPMLDPEVVAEGSAIFFAASFANHSCVRPNVAPAFLDSLSETPFVTMRNVEAGEELLFDYCAGVTHTADKRVRVYMSHGFVCNCEAHT